MVHWGQTSLQWELRALSVPSASPGNTPSACHAWLLWCWVRYGRNVVTMGQYSGERVWTSVNLCYSCSLQPGRRPGMTSCYHAKEDNETNNNSEQSMNQTSLCSSLCCPGTPGRPLHLVATLVEHELLRLPLCKCQGAYIYMPHQPQPPGCLRGILTAGNICWLEIFVDSLSTWGLGKMTWESLWISLRLSSRGRVKWNLTFST